ncbi:MFS transporter [Arthrobacter sp. NPDC089319]|uniref:MFS transporter n=1 Tax=Arthrobacter sp. NPDC089319 TaxID=3155915 RepID=UPI0034186090
MGAASLLTTGVSALGPMLSTGLDLSRAQFGAFAVVLFTSTALLSVPFGRWVDGMNYRVGLAMNFGLALLALLTLATAVSYSGFIGSAVLGGAALAFSNPLTNRMVGLLSDPVRQGSLIATKQIGPQVSQIITATLYPAVAAVLTWRAGFGLGAILLSLVLAAVLLWLLPRVKGQPQRHEATLKEENTRRLAHPKRGLTVFTVFALLSGVVYQTVFFTLPLFAHEQLHFEPGLAALTGGVLGATGLLARLAWGALADRLTNYTTALVVIGALTVTSVLLFLAAGAFEISWALWTGAAVFGASGTAVTVLLTSALLRYYPPERAGTATGLVSMGTFVGFASGPFLFGAMADSIGYADAWTAVAVVAAVATILPFAVGPQRSRTKAPTLS